MTTLMWFRNDLRSTDNTALHHAAHAAAQSSSELRALFIATPGQWAKHHLSLRQQNLIYHASCNLQQSLAELGVALDIITVDHFTDIPAFFKNYCKEHQVKALYANREYLLNEIARDQAVANALDIQCHWFHDRLLLEPGSVLNGSNEPYRVFTPFAKRWQSVLRERDCRPHPKPQPKQKISAPVTAQPQIPRWCDAVDISGWPSDEKTALQRLRAFCRHRVSDYQQQRDLPATEGTSQLSSSLAIGLLSPRQCLARLRAEHPEDNSGTRCWLNELAWREFYQHIAFHFPRVVRGKAFKSETDNIAWRQNRDDFARWCEGRTGFPIVDAGMRQLNQTGWMHNRLRMITASFLVKDLLIDWRWGERYFMSQLIDADFAANNGGWQWAASTGTDAAPYFRVFNPTTQGKRFDPEGNFIRQFVSELAGLPTSQIHQPPLQQGGYPPAMVDHSEARKQAIMVFQSLVD